ncbi:TPA: hypothetical protein ACJXXT_000240 [Pseudomonas aeruginosa]|uniref:hypothetical protein n=1 Tax=Pseudomonas putida TaxID=303 RepID=UPI001BB083E2|nr:hypothetical protein [Pseudomonas putida]QUG90792.1 hypothetical protein GR140_19190 [Pseudomonas putida]
MNTATNAAVETANTNVNVEGQEGNEASANTELNVVKGVHDDPKATIADYSKLALAGLYDKGFVYLLEDMSKDIAILMEPKNYDAEIGSLQNELLATKDLTKRFGIMEAITKLMNEQAAQGSEIRTKLEGVPFHEIAVAYASDIRALVESVMVDHLKRGQATVVKSKRLPKDGSTTTASNAGPTENVTFEVKGVSYTVKAGKGRLNSDILVIAEEHAKAVKDPEAQKKPNFIQALKDGKVKGAKVTKVETV